MIQSGNIPVLVPFWANSSLFIKLAINIASTSGDIEVPSNVNYGICPDSRYSHGVPHPHIHDAYHPTLSPLPAHSYWHIVFQSSFNQPFPVMVDFCWWLSEQFNIFWPFNGRIGRFSPRRAIAIEVWWSGESDSLQQDLRGCDFELLANIRDPQDWKTDQSCWWILTHKNQTLVLFLVWWGLWRCWLRRRLLLLMVGYGEQTFHSNGTQDESLSVHPGHERRAISMVLGRQPSTQMFCPPPFWSQRSL